MIEFILDNLDFILGYIAGLISCFIAEMICIASGHSDIDKWMEEGDKDDNK